MFVQVSHKFIYCSLGIIPKTSSRERIQENCSIFEFELTREDFHDLESIVPSDHHYCWNPTDIC